MVMAEVLNRASLTHLAPPSKPFKSVTGFAPLTAQKSGLENKYGADAFVCPWVIHLRPTSSLGPAVELQSL